MTIDTLKDQLPDYARDLKLNLSSVLTLQGAPGLSERQIAATALSTAIVARNPQVTSAIETWAKRVLDDAYVNGA
jgi:alkyl hydroperoxide reductase subunit D